MDSSSSCPRPRVRSCPPRGYDAGENTYQAPAADGSKATAAVIVSPTTSQRLQLLATFQPCKDELCLQGADQGQEHV